MMLLNGASSDNARNLLKCNFFKFNQILYESCAVTTCVFVFIILMGMYHFWNRISKISNLKSFNIIKL